MVSIADGHAEQEAAKLRVSDARQVKDDANIDITLDADKGYEVKEFIDALQEMKVIPHFAQNTTSRYSAVPDEVAVIAGYAVSQPKRKLIEQGYGWARTVGNIRAGVFIT